MPDINLPSGIVNVQWQEDRAREDGDQKPRDPPAEKVAESYEESSRSVTDKITILGIPVSLMTTQVQSTIAGLVAEVDHLKARLNRFERAAARPDDEPDIDFLSNHAFVRALDKALSVPPTAGYIRELVLVVVSPYEDIRQSSGLLSANETLAEVATRISESGHGAAPIGLIGGPTVAALLTQPEPAVDTNEDEDVEVPSTADIIRRVLEASAYTVAGLDMALRFRVSSVRVETGQSAIHAIGQADHVLRS